MHIKRYLTNAITEDLKEKMVFIGGPRQVGKTTLAEMIGEHEYSRFAYRNWDCTEHQRAILKNEHDPRSQLLILTRFTSIAHGEIM